MKKILFTAALVAGTTFGFAKDNVQKEEVKTVTTKEVKQVVNTAQMSSLDEALKATCMDVHAFFNEVTVDDGNGGTYTDYEYAGTIEVSYECDNASTNLYVWFN